MAYWEGTLSLINEIEEKHLEDKLPYIKEFEKKKRRQFEDYFATAPNFVLDACSVAYLEKGDILLEENTEADTIYFVGKGVIKAVDYSVFGAKYDFMRFDDTYALGGLEVLTNDKIYRTTLQAESKCIVVKLPRKVYERWIDSDTRVLRMEAANVSGYLLEQAKKSRAYILLQGTERIACILLDMYERGQNKGVLRVNATKNEFAELSGVSTKTIYRSFIKFEENDWITRNGNEFTMNEQQYQDCKIHMDKLVTRYRD